MEEAQELLAFPGLFGSARLLAAKAHGLNLFVLDAPYLYGRPGNPYVGPEGVDWPDNAYRFAALAKVAAEVGLGLLRSFVPDIVHVCLGQALRKGSLKGLVSLDFALDVPHHPAKIGLERWQAPVRPLELLGMSVALLLDERELAHPRIGLAQVSRAPSHQTPSLPFSSCALRWRANAVRR